MISSALTSATTAFLLLSPSAARPTQQEARAAPTCKLNKLTLDELPNSAGYSRSPPNSGYDYKGLEIRENSWGIVSTGLSYNGDSTENDRVTTKPYGQQQSTIVTHSGSNALMTVEDGFGYAIDSAHYSGGHRYYDPRSLWVAPEIAGKAFSFRVECEGYRSENNRVKIWSVPAMAQGGMYQVRIPADWVHMWRCRVGATDLQQVIVDDFEYCLWDFPYAVPIPW